MASTLTKTPTDVRSPLSSTTSYRLRRWSIITIVLLALSCMIVPMLALALRPPPIHSHEQQINYVLHTQGITPVAITLGERWPDHINFQYGTNVYPYGYKFTIVLADGIQQDGWLECAQHEASCTVTILGLGLRKTALPEFTSEPALPIPAWLKPYFSSILP